jgi:hypothetical protein
LFGHASSTFPAELVSVVAQSLNGANRLVGCRQQRSIAGEAAVGYSDAGQIVVGRSRDALPHGSEGLLGMSYLVIGQPERLAEWCRAQLARRRDTHIFIRSWLVYALAVAGSGGEAMDAADGLIEAAEATGNPSWLAGALGAYGVAFRDADPVGALNALRRGLVIAQDSGNRTQASLLALNLARLEAEHGDTLAAFDHPTLVIRNCYNAGDTTAIRWPSSPFFSTGSHATNRRPPSPGSRSVLYLRRRSPKSPPRSPTCATSSARRPTNRSPARVRR